MEKNNMRTFTYIGIDVSKAHLDFYIPTSGKTLQVKNDKIGYRKLQKELGDLDDAFLVMEATGGYEQGVFRYFVKLGIPCNIVNPKHSKDFSRSMGTYEKTDRIDAKVLSAFGEFRKLQPMEFPDEDRQKLRDLVRRRLQIVANISKERNHLEKASGVVKKDIRQHIEFLEKRLEKLDKSIDDVISSSQELSEKAEILGSVSGIGSQSISIILSELPELGNLSHRKISKIVGVAPLAYDSGKLKGKRSIYGGRKNIRNVLYMAALSASRHNPRIRSFYRRLIENGKSHKVALVACVHKLLIIINAMIYTGSKWDCDTADTVLEKHEKMAMISSVY